MNITLILSLYPQVDEKKLLIKSKSFLHFADFKYQFNLLNGLVKNNINFTGVSLPFVGSFPKEFPDLFYKNSIDNQMFGNNKIVYLDFFNLYGIKNLYRTYILNSYFKKLSKNNNRDIFIIYSTHLPFLKASLSAKKRKKNTKIILIVPDLPNFTNLKRFKNPIYSLFKFFNNTFFYSNLVHIDGFIFLTESMNVHLNKYNKPFCIIEGFSSNYNIQHVEYTEKSELIVYTGSLNYSFGIVDLINSFMNIRNPSLKLIICGKGEAENYIKEALKIDNRIVFRGQLSSHETLEILLSATILINPRRPNNSFDKYSFSSKNIDYLSTGIPLISYRLNGMPEEYFNYIYTVNGSDTNSLKRKIEEVLLIPKSERSKFGNIAKDFVLKNKNDKLMTHKIIDLIKNI